MKLRRKSNAEGEKVGQKKSEREERYGILRESERIADSGPEQIF